jgi:amino acid adenylation domain-containing protein
MKLTLPQQDIYFEQLLYPDQPIYNIGAKIEIKGNLDIGILERAFTALIDQHDAYRSILIKEKDHVLIKSVDKHQSQLGFIDFSNFSNPAAKATSYIQDEFVKPFDLFARKLLHVFTLIKVEENFFYLFSVYHHIITDGWGTSLMFQRLVQNYNEIYEFNEIKTSYPYNYAEFCKDDDLYQHSELFDQDKNYWLQKFNTLPEKVFDRLDTACQFNKSSRRKLIINRTVYNKLNQLAATSKCSAFHLILGILYAYVGRKYQNNDLAIGLPVLNRSKSAYKKTVGLFMGISPLRMFLDFNSTFVDLVDGIKNQLRQDYRHQRFPLGKLIKELRLFKDKLFDITLSYEKQDYSSHFQNTETRVIPLTHQSERVALAIYIREFDEKEDVEIDFDHNLNYFDECRITQFVTHIENMIYSVLTDPTQRLKDLTYLTEKESTQLLMEFNKTSAAYPRDKTILDLFKEHVGNIPEKIAVRDERNSFSYSELNTRSDLVAKYLISIFGERNNTPIAVLLGRSSHVLVILLGILKSGRSYIPLDPAFPKDRLNYILANSQTNILICDKKYAWEDIGNGNITVLLLDDILGNMNQSGERMLHAISPLSTAYVIYTSGSTGNPKGVEIGHQSLLNFVISIQQKPGINSGDVLFSLTTYSFDISILELFIPILSGAALYIANQDILSEPKLIIRKLEEIKPTLIQATPGFYQLLFNANWQGDKKMKVLCGGDLLSETLAEKLLNHCGEVWNMYGPTESTIWSSTKKIEQPKHASNIGKPINNTTFFILDRFLSLQPVEAPGAIYIGGDGLAKGYYKNELLTKKAFIQNPYDTRS